MSQIVPFKALRPRQEYAKEVAACPYDVVNLEEARAIGRANPLSFLHVEKSEIDVPAYPDAGDVYGTARRNLRALVEKGVLFHEEKDCFYLYRQRMGSHVQTGIVAGTSVDEYESGKIKRHELTRTDKETDRIRHIAAVGAQTGPVFLAYRSRPAIDRIVERIVAAAPEYDFTAPDGVVHTVWVVDDRNDIALLQRQFAEVESLYIADGHHRAAAAAAVAKIKRAEAAVFRGDEAYNHTLSVVFPHDQLRIMDYNRAVRDLNGLETAGFLEQAAVRFLVEKDFPEKSPRRCHEFGMYLNGGWLKLTAKSGSYDEADPLGNLDVSILQNNLLEPALGIRDPRTDKRIEFIGGIRGMAELERLVDTCGFAVAFSLYPTSLDQLMTVADSGKVMPPKSTWFEPKLLSGLFVHLLE